MIVSLRGTNGSGKSSVALEFLKWPTKPLDVDEKGRPNNYEVSFPNKKKLYVIGRYNTACGGCDSIQPYSEIWPRVVKYAELGHVLFEGLLVSSSYGNIGRASEVYGDKFVFAFLDTPVETCIKRVEARRKQRGNLEPLNPYNLTKKWEDVARSIPIIRKIGRKVVMINHKKAFAEVCALYGVEV